MADLLLVSSIAFLEVWWLTSFTITHWRYLKFLLKVSYRWHARQLVSPRHCRIVRHESRVIDWKFLSAMTNVRSFESNETSSLPFPRCRAPDVALSKLPTQLTIAHFSARHFHQDWKILSRAREDFLRSWGRLVTEMWRASSYGLLTSTAKAAATASTTCEEDLFSFATLPFRWLIC